MQGTTPSPFSAAGAGGVLLAVLVGLRRRRRPHRLGGRLRRDRRADRRGRRDPRRDLRRLPPLRGHDLMLGALFSTPRAGAGSPAARGRRDGRARCSLLPVVRRRRLEHRRLGARRACSGSAVHALDLLVVRARSKPGSARRPRASRRSRSSSSSIALLVVLFAALAADRNLALTTALTYGARVHVRARALARLLLRGDALDEAPDPARLRGARARSRRRPRSRAGTSTRRPSSSSTSGSRSTSARSTCRSRRRSST